MKSTDLSLEVGNPCGIDVLESRLIRGHERLDQRIHRVEDVGLLPGHARCREPSDAGGSCRREASGGGGLLVLSCVGAVTSPLG